MEVRPGPYKRKMTWHFSRKRCTVTGFTQPLQNPESHRPKKTWGQIVEKDCQAHKLNMEDAMDHNRWRKQIRDH